MHVLAELVHEREELVVDVKRETLLAAIGTNALHVKLGGRVLAIAEYDKEIYGAALVDAIREALGIISNQPGNGLAPRRKNVGLGAVQRRNDL